MDHFVSFTHLREKTDENDWAKEIRYARKGGDEDPRIRAGSTVSKLEHGASKSFLGKGRHAFDWIENGFEMRGEGMWDISDQHLHICFLSPLFRALQIQFIKLNASSSVYFYIKSSSCLYTTLLSAPENLIIVVFSSTPSPKMPQMESYSWMDEMPTLEPCAWITYFFPTNLMV